MNKKRVVVCGSSGFIGHNICAALADRADIDLIGTYLNSNPPAHSRMKAVRVDLTKKDDVDKLVKGADILIQAAATTSGARDIIERPYYHVTDNAVMNSLLFRAAFEHNVSHVIFFSCSVMYQPSDNPVRETDFNANDPIYPKYFGVGWTKVYIEKMCEFYSRLGRTRYTVIRHSNIYGPHDKFDLEKSHVFGATVAKVMAAKDGSDIIVWGTGEEERDLLYVSDLMDFIDLAIEKQNSPFELVNVGCGSSVSIRDLVKKIISRSGKDLKIRFDASKPTIKTKLCLDIRKAKDIFGWEPKVSLDDGIKEMMEWYSRNKIRENTRVA